VDATEILLHSAPLICHTVRISKLLHTLITSCPPRVAYKTLAQSVLEGKFKKFLLKNERVWNGKV